MRKYWFLAKVAFQDRLADRADFFLEIFGNTVVLLAVIAVWSAAYRGMPSGRGMIDYTTLLTYLLVGGVLTGFYRRAQGDDINDEIAHGTLSAILTKPISPSLYWFMRDVAVRMIELPFVIGVVMLISYLFHFRPILTYAPMQVATFVMLALVAMLFHYFLFTAVAFLGFWLEQTWGERFVLNVIIEVASGALIPLTFFPSPWSDILHILPFGVLVATPVEALLGIQAGWLPAVWACGWLALSIVGTQMLLKRGLRRYAGEGI